MLLGTSPIILVSNEYYFLCTLELHCCGISRCALHNLCYHLAGSFWSVNFWKFQKLPMMSENIFRVFFVLVLEFEMALLKNLKGHDEITTKQQETSKPP